MPPTVAGPRPAGFTIIEMIVAIAISTLLMFLINRLFIDTTNAVSRGIAVSDIITANRAIGSQIKLDTDAMIGPQESTGGGDILAEGGFMVILQALYGDFDHDGHLAGDDDDNWIIDSKETYANEGFPMIAPNGIDQTYGMFRSDQLVFVRKNDSASRLYPLTPSADTTFENTTDVSKAPYTLVWYGHLFKTPPNGDGAAAVANDYNTLANNGVLGRQALFLYDAAAAPSVYADGAWYDAPVVGWSGTGFTAARYNATADVAWAALSNAGNVPAANVILTNASGGEDKRLDHNDSDLEYQRSAYRFAFAFERLWANMQPDLSGGNYQSWQLAQMHPFLAEHVTNVIVEWAGDTDLDGKIDTDGSTPPVIKWYSGFPDSGNHIYTPTGGSVTAYYDSSPAMNGVSLATPINPTNPANPHNADRAFVWRHDDDTAHSTPGTGSKWPYLIRIRYQVSDARGRPGTWFEHIIKVPRP